MPDITKADIDRLLKIPGSVRGVALITDAEFIFKNKGEAGIAQLEKELEKFFCPIDYSEIKSMDFYPIGLRLISLLAIKSVFDFDDEKIKEIGNFAPKASLIIKFFMQYFMSLTKTIKQLSSIWKKHYTAGELVSTGIDEKNRRGTIQLRDADFDPIFCCYLEGYLTKVLGMIVGKQAICKETKCTFKGDNYHEYSFKW